MQPPQPNAAAVTSGRFLVTLGALVWILGTVLGGDGVVGAGGMSDVGAFLSSRATLIAPETIAYTIWFVIYIGMVGYVVWQWLPRTDTSQWAFRTRVPAAVAIALNGLWPQAVTADLLGWCLLVMVGTFATLCRIVAVVKKLPREGGPAVVVWAEGVCGLYLGWISVATAVNLASWLGGFTFATAQETTVAVTVAVLVLLVVVAALLLRSTTLPGFQLAFTAAVVWGLTWIGVARFTGPLHNELVGGVALVSAVLILLAGVAEVTFGKRRAVTVRVGAETHVQR